MTKIQRPHLLGVDDGPFDKRRDDTQDGYQRKGPQAGNR